MERYDRVSLEHVRVRGAPVDAGVARVRLSTMLSSALLHPPAIPPSAVLVVRSMADPLPRRIGEFKAGTVVRGEWEQAAQNRLGELYARAARPAWGPVPLTAEAVLFADYGELMACLAMDLNSAGGGAWWWRSIVKYFPLSSPGSPATYWLRTWEEHPTYIPAALEHLMAQHQAGSVLNRISPVQAWKLLRVLAQAFDLPASLIPLNPDREPADFPTPAACFTGREDAGRETLDAPPRSVPSHGDAGSIPYQRLPWEPFVPAGLTAEAIGLERHALLGLGLLLRRSPQIAFTSSFADRYQAWIAQQVRARRESPPAPDEPPVGAPLPSAPALRRNPAGEIRVQPEPVSEQPASPNELRPPDQSAMVMPQTSPKEWEAGRFTRAGGVLYLIHLLRHMDLLRSFDTGLSGWALLELLARCLLGQAFDSLADDAIWSVLTELDGRDPGVSAASGFYPQPTYEAPESWLRGRDPQPLFARFRSRGVELWHAQGFLVLDSIDPRVPSEIGFLPGTRSRRRRRRSRAEVRPSGLQLSPELRRFLHFVLPYARSRLANILHGITLEQACSRRGKLLVSRSHVDLVMRMNQISVPVRLAGLDANPGWVPELGRVVTFHFLEEDFGE